MTPAELQAMLFQQQQQTSGAPNRLGSAVDPYIRQPQNQWNFAPGSYNDQAFQLYRRGMPDDAYIRPSAPGGSPPPTFPGTPQPKGAGGPGTAPYRPEWESSLPPEALVSVNQYYGAGATRAPKGRPSSQDVENFYMVNMGRRPTPFEIDYYTGGKRWDQLIRDTGQNRGIASLTGYTEGNPRTPLDPSYYDWRQALAGQV